MSRDFGPLGPHAQGMGEAVCGAGRFAVGGGVVTDGGPDVSAIDSTFPSDGTGTGTGGTLRGWTAVINDLSATQSVNFTVYAVCAVAQAVTAGP